MNLRLWVLLLLSSFAVAQANPPAPKPPVAHAAPAAKSAPAAPAAEAKPAEVAPGAAVITIPGLCKSKPASPADCKTVVTRAEFDKLVDALSGGQTAVPPQAKRELAMRYARLLLFAEEAEKNGLKNTPEAQELLHFAQMQVLQQELTRSLQRKAKATPEEIQTYYIEHPQRYTELTMERIMVPIKTSPEGKSNETEMKALAADLRQRAASAGDFKVLQAEAYEKAGLQHPPEPKMTLTPESVPPNHKTAVSQLKPGEISQPIQDVGGFYIYKLDASKPRPLEQVTKEIENVLTQQKFQEEMESLVKSAPPDLNPQYFGPAPAPGMGMRGMMGGQRPPMPPRPPAAPPPLPPTPKP